MGENPILGVDGPEELLRSGQVAGELGVSIWTVHNMVADGRIEPTTKLAGPRGAYLFTRAAVEAARQRLAPTAAPSGDAA
jgi:hypothetical protein